MTTAAIPHQDLHADQEHIDQNPLVTPFEYTIFNGRWVLLALYAVFSLVTYTYIAHGCWDMLRFCLHGIWVDTDGERLAQVFEFLDEMMIASALYLITGGSALVFAKDWVNSRIFKKSADRPQAFSHLSATGLKAKMGMSLVGVSAVLLISLLVSVMDSSTLAVWLKTVLAIAIHFTLLASVVVFTHVLKNENLSH